MSTWHKPGLALLAAAALAGAQDYGTMAGSSGGTARPTASSSDSKAPRTGIYNMVTKGNAAADLTVEDFLTRGNLINGRQFIAGWTGLHAGDLTDGAFAFNQAGYNWFGSMRMHNFGPNQAEFRAGLSPNDAWAAGAIVDFAKTWNGSDDRTTWEGDGLGLFGSLRMGSGDLYGQLEYNFAGFDSLDTEFPGLTNAGGGGDNYRKTAGATTKNNRFNLHAGWKRDARAEGEHAINPDGQFTFSDHSVTGLAEDIRLIDINLWFHHAYALRLSDGLGVFLGDSWNLRFQNADGDLDGSALALMAVPNLAFRKDLGHGFEGQFGAGADLIYRQARKSLVAGGPENALLTANPDVALGLRWVHENLAVEGSLSEGLLTNGPQFIGGGTPGLLGSAGVTLGF